MRAALTVATRVAFALVAIGVVVQVFMAGVAIFGDGDFEAHKGMGWGVHTIGIAALVLAILGPRTPLAMGGALALVVLNTIQVMLSNADAAGLAALHPTLALAVLALAAYLYLEVSRAAPRSAT